MNGVHTIHLLRNVNSECSSFYYLYKMKYLLILGFMLLFLSNCIAQNNGEKEYRKFCDSVDNEWDKIYLSALKDPKISERKKDSLLNSYLSYFDKSKFYASCFCSRVHEYPHSFSGVCLDCAAHENQVRPKSPPYYQTLKPVELPTIDIKPKISYWATTLCCTVHVIVLLIPWTLFTLYSYSGTWTVSNRTAFFITFIAWGE